MEHLNNESVEQDDVQSLILNELIIFKDKSSAALHTGRLRISISDVDIWYCEDGGALVYIGDANLMMTAEEIGEFRAFFQDVPSSMTIEIQEAHTTKNRPKETTLTE